MMRPDPSFHLVHGCIQGFVHLYLTEYSSTASVAMVFSGKAYQTTLRDVTLADLPEHVEHFEPEQIALWFKPLGCPQVVDVDRLRDLAFRRLLQLRRQNELSRGDARSLHHGIDQYLYGIQGNEDLLLHLFGPGWRMLLPTKISSEYAELLMLCTEFKFAMQRLRRHPTEPFRPSLKQVETPVA